MEIVGYIFGSIILLYALLIAVLSIQWFKIPKFDCGGIVSEKGETKISILIPFRNEENNLAHIFNDLEAIRYPTSLLQVIFIDDDSADKSISILQNLIHSGKLSYKLLHSTNGKKKAIEAGLNQASGDFIISLDADVRFGPNLVSCYNKYFQLYKPKLIAGPVSFENNSSFLGNLFSLEFSSLIVSAAAAIGIGKPIMLNAANMGFERTVALEFQKEVYQSEIASGDDQFLLEAIVKKYGAQSVHFIKSQQAIVKTMAPENLSSFFNQRIRWASKTSSYTSRFSQVVAVLVFLINLVLLASFGYAIFQQCALSFIIVFGFKILIDLPILLSASRFFRQQKNMLYYPLLQFFYPWYIVIVAIWSMFGDYSWKGRKY